MKNMAIRNSLYQARTVAVTSICVCRFCQHLKIFQSSYHSGSSKGRIKQKRTIVQEPVVDDVDLDVQMWDELPDEKLGNSDELGWAPIHHAARKGVIHIIKRALVYNNQLMEQKTIDVAAITPLLIAVQARYRHHHHHHHHHHHLHYVVIHYAGNSNNTQE